jgi:hypothetical protein
MKVGNWWAFQGTSYDSLGNAGSTSIDTMKVLSDTTIQNEHWFYTNHGIYRNTSKGVWFWYVNSYLIYKYPCTASDSFSTVSAMIRVVSTNEKQTVPYGEVSCYHYQATFYGLDGFQTNDYLSPGKGFVSYEDGAMTPGGRWYVNYRERLVSYYLK